MVKKEKAIYVMTGFILALVLSIVSCLTLILTGVIKFDDTSLKIKTDNAYKMYDGEPLYCHEFDYEGELEKGHEIKIAYHYKESGKNVFIGNPDGSLSFRKNTFTVVIVNEDGKDVTNQYSIKKIPGVLVIADEFDNDFSKYADLLEDEKGFSEEDIEKFLEDAGLDSDFGMGDMTGDLSKYFGMLEGEMANVPIFEVTSSVDGTVYLRNESYGDYTGEGFADANPYYSMEKNPLNFTSRALENSGLESSSIHVKNLKTLLYFLPYYSSDAELAEGDLKLDRSLEEYVTSSIIYDYLKSDPEIIPDPSCENAEKEYCTYVYENYCNISNKLKNKLRDYTKDEPLAAKRGKEQVELIAEYVQNCATYNLQYEKIPDDEDMVLYFLTKSKEGICQHFAATATMIFRAYGIPARYTVGFVAQNLTADETYTVVGKDAHAWVEVYVDGIGWMQVEVTGGSSRYEDEDGADYGEIRDITIQTASATKYFDGKELSVNSIISDGGEPWEVLDGNLRSQHYIIATELEQDVYTRLTRPDSIENLGYGYRIMDEYGNDVTNEYNVTQSEENGTLTVEKLSITVTSSGAEFEYDGLEHSYPEFTAELNYGLFPYPINSYVEAYYLCAELGHELTAEAKKFVEVGKNPNEIKITIKDGETGEDVTDVCYDIQYKTGGIINIHKRRITLMTQGFEKDFDNKELSFKSMMDDGVNPWILIEGALKKDSHAIVAIESLDEEYARITRPAEVENKGFAYKIIDTALENLDVTDEYEVTVSEEYGMLKINKIKFTVYTGSKYDYIYDGNMVKHQVFNVIDKDGNVYSTVEELESFCVAFGHQVEIIANPVGPDAGEYDNVITFLIKEGEEDVTDSCYAIDYAETGIIVINQRDLIVDTGEYSATYDGTEHSNPKILSVSGLLGGHELIVDLTKEYTKQTFVTLNEYGELAPIENKVFVYVMAGEDDVSKNYNIIYNGTIEIKPCELYLTEAGDSWTYDGEEHSKNDFALIEGLPTDHEIFVSEEPFTTIKNVGKVENVIGFVIKHNGVEVDKINFIIDITPANLEITPVELTITTDGGSWVYDGIEHDNKDSFKCVGLPEIFTLEKSEEYPTVKNVIDGPKENRIDYVIKYKGEEVDKTNFDISETWGTLIIIPNELTVSTEGGSWTYDGEWHDNKDSFTHSELPETFTFEFAEKYPKVRDVKDGPLENKIEYVLKCNGNEVDISNVILHETWGWLEITPLDLTVSSASGEWTYDGEWHNNKDSFNHSDLPEGFILEVTDYAKIRDVKDSPMLNVIEYVITYNGEQADLSNFNVGDPDWGKLIIKPIYLEESSGTKSWTYDGELHNYKESFVLSGLPNNKFSYEITGYKEVSEVSAKPTENEIFYDITYNDGGNIEVVDPNNFIFSTDWGYLTITPYELTVYSDSGSWTYDGKPHDKKDSLTSSALPSDKFKLTPNGSYATITNVSESGKANNVIGFSITYNNQSVNLSNFNIDPKWGDLTITPWSFKIVSASETFDYDGEYHYKNEYESSPDLPDGMRIELTGDENVWTGVRERGETKDNVLVFDIVDEYGNTVDKSNFNIDQSEKGKLSIKMPINVYIKTPDKDWVYDGKEHYQIEGWEFRYGSKLPEGCTFVVTKSTTRTDIGKEPNEFIEWQIIDQSGNVIWDHIRNRTEKCVNISSGELEIKKQGGFDPNGGGGGSGLNDDFNGDLSKKPFSTQDVDVLSLYSIQSGKVYLRGQSFGAYNGSGFGTPNIYNGGTNELYFAANALNNGSIKSNTIKITNMLSTKYYLPYYTYDPVAGGNDVLITDTADEWYTVDGQYTVNMLMYDYLSGQYTFNLNTNADEVQNYRDFVNANYLTIDPTLQAKLLSLTNGYGFNGTTDIENIKAIADYIKNAATYNMDFAEFPEGEDVVLYFLTKSNQGVCQHFAAAGTMMFRAYGIPARYTVGYSAYANREATTIVKASSAHAWVEVYIAGLGWVPVEVTPSSGEEPAPQPTRTLSIKTKSAEWKYDGVSHSYTGGIELAEGSDQLYTGHKLALDETQTYPTITDIGKVKNALKVKVVDENGQDVSSEYNIVYEDKNIGTLWVYKAKITVGTESLSKVYDGIALHSDVSGITYLDYDSSKPVWIKEIDGKLDAGHKVKIKGTYTSIPNAVSASNVIAFTIVDEYDNEVAEEYYKEVSSYGKLVITARPIEISSKSKTVTYNPDNPITLTGEFSDLSVTSGELVTGDYIASADMNATPISKPGYSTNSFTNVVIKNAAGQNVTNNYKITFVEGKLTILQP